jgi:hypothetical protein
VPADLFGTQPVTSRRALGVALLMEDASADLVDHRALSWHAFDATAVTPRRKRQDV